MAAAVCLGNICLGRVFYNRIGVSTLFLVVQHTVDPFAKQTKRAMAHCGCACVPSSNVPWVKQSWGRLATAKVITTTLRSSISLPSIVK
jgi:hypothetical protein